MAYARLQIQGVEVSMKRILFTTMVLFFSISSMADQPEFETLLQNTSDQQVMTLIEDKNHDLMSSYDYYLKAHQQGQQLKKNRVHKQYSQFIQKKQAL